MKVSDIILGPLVAAIGLIALYAASLQPKPFFGSAYGGGLFPSIVGMGLILGGALLTLSAWRARDGEALFKIGTWINSPRHVTNVVAVLGSLVFYIATSNWLGFIISGFITLLVPLVQFTRAPVMSIIVSVITIAVVKFGFQDILRVPLPWGILEPYAGVLRWR